jgi:hypothetical protein
MNHLIGYVNSTATNNKQQNGGYLNIDRCSFVPILMEWTHLTLNSADL